VVGLRLWNPKGVDIPFAEVEQAVIEEHERYGAVCYYDPYAVVDLAQRCEARGIRVVRVQQTGGKDGTLKKMADFVIEAFRHGTIDIPQDLPFFDDLVTDLRKLELHDKGSWVRLESPRTADGHGDSASALAVAILGCRECEANQPAYLQGDLICSA
jgi:hypothetical protein